MSILRTSLALLFLLIASPSWGAIAVDGSAAYDAIDSGTTINTGNTNTIHASAMMVIDIVTLTTDDTTASVADGNKSSWVLVSNVAPNSTSRIELWKCADLLGANVTITVTLSNSREAAATTVFYSGVAAFGNVGTPTTGTSTSASISVTTQDNDNWVVAGCGSAQSLASNSVGTWRATAASNAGSAHATISDNTAASPGSVTNTQVVGASADWGCTAVELRTSAGTVTRHTGKPIFFQ